MYKHFFKRFFDFWISLIALIVSLNFVGGYNMVTFCQQGAERFLTGTTR